MNLLEELRSLFTRWQRSTDEESAALRMSDWSRVDQCQQAKRALQRTLQDLTQAAGAAATEKAVSQMRELVANLVAQERSNSAFLETRMKEGRQRQAELQCTRRNLSRMQSSYAPFHASHWHSYS